MKKKTTRLSKRTLTRLAKLSLAIEATKNRIAKERNTLREQVEDVEAILESADNAAGDAEAGLRHLNSAVDGLSQYL